MKITRRREMMITEIILYFLSSLRRAVRRRSGILSPGALTTFAPAARPRQEQV